MPVFPLELKSRRRVVDALLAGVMVLSAGLLVTLIGYQVWPHKTFSVKVPVATDKAEYYPGQSVGGIFFGEVHYSGQIDIIAEVFCKNYRGTIKTDSGDDVFRIIGVPAKLEGTSRRIGTLPKDVPIGENCVIQLVDTYVFRTPFGDREENIKYYTQNFKILSQADVEKRELELEAGRQNQKEQFGEEALRNNPNTLPEQKEVPDSSNPRDGRWWEPRQ